MTQLELTTDREGSGAYRALERHKAAKLVCNQHKRKGSNTVGMFEKEVQLTKAPFVEVGGKPFYLHSAKYLGKAESADYGSNDKASVVAGPDPDTKDDFIVFGVMAQQVSRMDSGDLPAWVKIEKDGRANCFRPAESDEIPF